jgi:hypothetical protein
MKTTVTRRDARSQAARRLRTITIGTAVIGVVATGGLSALAAITNDGRAIPAVDYLFVAVIAASLAWRILPRGTMAPAGAARLGSGNGG